MVETRLVRESQLLMKELVIFWATALEFWKTREGISKDHIGNLVYRADSSQAQVAFDVSKF